ncbi:hypothetical protein [Halovivax sp.]|uniref:hypothetical protein n=1 Tax=Halovivax sp. TaxID=1935978 RepID=UPI0025C452A7|nr:hypothetical protein [Halovivax sp.]
MTSAAGTAADAPGDGGDSTDPSGEPPVDGRRATASNAGNAGRETPTRYRNVRGSFALGVVVLAALFREEWRLHTTLFGGARFLAVPAVLGAFAVFAAAALAETGTAASAVAAGLHVFAVGFGLYAGTAGFAGSDMLEDVFGDLSFLLGTAATLPIPRRVLFGLFLLKDAVYYGVAFVLPMALAVVGLEGLSASTPLAVAALWLSLWLAFVVGMTVTVAGIAARTRGVPSVAIAGLAGLGAVGLWATGEQGAALDLLVTAGRGPLAAVGAAGVAAGVGIAALAAYDPTHEPPSRTSPERFERLRRRLPSADPLVAKAVLDLSRSSGGFAKPFVSVGILFVLVAGLLGVVEAITGVAPAPGIFFGGVLGLSAFTTYNWLTQFDDVAAYLAHPVSVADVFRAKRTAFVLVGAPTVALPYAFAVGWFGATPVDALAGAAVLVGYSLYYYGLTVAVAGFSPNEFLFDGARFSAFGLGVAIVLVPTLVAAFAVVPPTLPVAAALVIASLVLGAAGVGLSSRAAAHWSDRYLAGTAR